MKIKNKMTVTRREGGRDNGVKKRKGHQGTCIKDPWTKTMVGGDCMWKLGCGQGRGENGGKMGMTVIEQQ